MDAAKLYLMVGSYTPSMYVSGVQRRSDDAVHVAVRTEGMGRCDLTVRASTMWRGESADVKR